MSVRWMARRRRSLARICVLAVCVNSRACVSVYARCGHDYDDDGDDGGGGRRGMLCAVLAFSEPTRPERASPAGREDRACVRARVLLLLRRQ